MTDPTPLQPLSPAKIAPNDPATIITALAAAAAAVAQAWPGSTGLAPGAPNVLTIVAGALMLSLFWVKHMLSAAALTSTTPPPSTARAAGGPSDVTAEPSVRPSEPPQMSEAQRHASEALSAAVAGFEQAFGSRLHVELAEPTAAYPPAGVPIRSEPTPGT